MKLLEKIFKKETKAKPSPVPELDMVGTRILELPHYVIIDKPFLLQQRKSVHVLRNIWDYEKHVWKKPKIVEIHPVIFVDRYRATYIGENMVAQEIMPNVYLHRDVKATLNQSAPIFIGHDNHKQQIDEDWTQKKLEQFVVMQKFAKHDRIINILKSNGKSEKNNKPTLAVRNTGGRVS